MKGIVNNPRVQEIVSSTISKAIGRNICFMVEWVPTLDNPADYPSRSELQAHERARTVNDLFDEFAELL